MTATFIGGALGVAASGWLMERYGWSGVAVFGVVLGAVAGVIHLFGARTRRSSALPLH